MKSYKEQVSLKEYIRSLFELVHSGKLKEADELAIQVVQQNPGNVQCFLLAADLKIRLRNHQEALNLVDCAIKASSSEALIASFIRQQLSFGQLEICNDICEMAAEKYLSSYDVFNVWGVVLRYLKDFKGSVEKFDIAINLNSSIPHAFINKANTYLASQQFEKAKLSAFKALEIEPNDVDANKLIAIIYNRLGEKNKAINTLEKAIKNSSNNQPLIVELSAIYYNDKQYQLALEAIEKWWDGKEDFSIMRTKAIILRQLDRCEEARVDFHKILDKYPNDIETLVALANLYYYTKGDVEEALKYYNLAYEKNPNNVNLLGKLCHFLLTLRGETGTSEGDNLDRAYEIVLRLIRNTPSICDVADSAQSVLLKLLDHETFFRLGNKNEFMNHWIKTHNSPPLTYQFSQVETFEDRVNLLEAHRKGGEFLEKVAAQSPIKRKVKQRLNNKTRIGILSSDLRNHPVGYFVWPIVEYLDRNKFELYCYSGFPHGEDGIQQSIRGLSNKFTLFKEEASSTVAQNIADDCLDILFELGGTTLFNRIDICAYKPAPIQVSWLGYPHSIGLPTTIDYIMVDPYINPKDSRLLIEKPFIMPKTWVTLDKIGFHPVPITQVIPEDKNGYITFGSMNMPHKLNPRVLTTWAHIMNLVPNSRFFYVRPETASKVVRRNFCAIMEANGISSDRISFASTRREHLLYYNEIDFTLDPFPHTGGTTTCESLWMGVPVVTLIGHSFFERLSYSNLNNAGLGDLCATNLEDYKNIALNLVQDISRRRHLRNNLRDQIKQNPLGQPYHFYKDFESVVRKTFS